MTEKNCVADGCRGKTVRISNIFLHTLGSEPRTKPDFSEFVECHAWRCTKCGNIQLHCAEETVKVPL